MFLGNVINFLIAWFLENMKSMIGDLPRACSCWSFAAFMLRRGKLSFRIGMLRSMPLPCCCLFRFCLVILQKVCCGQSTSGRVAGLSSRHFTNSFGPGFCPGRRLPKWLVETAQPIKAGFSSNIFPSAGANLCQSRPVTICSFWLVFKLVLPILSVVWAFLLSSPKLFICSFGFWSRAAIENYMEKF